MTAHVIHLEAAPQDSQVGQAMHDAEAALNHLLELRNDPTTREQIADEEAELWRLKNTLEWLLTSITIEREHMDAAE